MRSSTAIPLVSMAILGRALAQNASTIAPPVSGNPVGVVYKATLPDEPFFAGADIEGNVKGYISGISTTDGNGIVFTVKFENLPKEGGPFSYHLHDKPAADGNCTSTAAHLDPFGRGQQPPCDSANPETCEVGDLSGKHGKIESDPFTAQFTDVYASTIEGVEAYFGNRSFVIHYANTTRLTCANFEKKAEGAPVPTGVPSNCTTVTSVVPTATGGATTPGAPESTPSSPTFPGAASAISFSIPLLIAGVAAAMIAL